MRRGIAAAPLKAGRNGRLIVACLIGLGPCVQCDAAAQLPAPDGPHAVGTTTFAWEYQPAVAVAFEAQWTRGPRQLVVQAWYPAAAAANHARAPYVFHADRIVAHQGAASVVQSEAATRLLEFSDTPTHASIDAAVVNTPQRLPAVVFSPGGGLPRHAYTTLYEALASHGYVVVAISHPGMGLDWFDAYGVVESAAQWKPAAGKDEEALDKYYEPLAQLLAADASFVVQQLQRLERGELEGVLSQRLMAQRVAVIGHSRGGKTVSRYCSGRSLCWAAVVLDNFPSAADRAAGFHCPTLILRTAVVAPPRWTAYRVAELARLKRSSEAVFEDRPITGIHHMSFTDLAVLAPGRHAIDGDSAAALNDLLRQIRAFLDLARSDPASRL